MKFTKVLFDLASNKITYRQGDFIAVGLASQSEERLHRGGAYFAIGGATSSRWGLLRNRRGDFIAVGLASQSAGRFHRGGACFAIGGAISSRWGTLLTCSPACLLACSPAYH